jgi:alginate O-acetyltransferase complex protein AlgI
MLFDTPIYLIFLSIVVLAYWWLPRRPQNMFLLAASYFFYGWWDWRFLGLILLSTVVDFYCARTIAVSNDRSRRRLLLILSVSMNLGFLGYFKYCDFFIDSFAGAAAMFGVHIPVQVLGILLPPGISFYTFQALAYIVDVYYKKLEPAESLLDYALFISLFPHLIAGPIQRPSHLLPQVQAERHFHSGHFFDGLMLITTGLLRKCVVADNCALIANAAFDGRLGEPGLGSSLIGIYAFAWQIYGDFSGYSDIARGSAQLLGFHFMVNFRQPYLATSLQDFWRRWHISLSTWLRDYLYIPLGGNRHGEFQTYRNLLLTMLIGGFWHGANWTFLIWGAIHGGGLALERLLLGGDRESSASPSMYKIWLQRIWIFHLVCLAWVFFRAQSVGAALQYLSNFGKWSWRPEHQTAALLVGAYALVLFLMDLLNEKREEEYLLEQTSPKLRIAVAWGLICLILFFTGNQSNAFIYFQF